MRHIDSKDIPQIVKSWENTQKIMESSLEEFCKIMSEDFSTWIFKSKSFIPELNFYGGQIYQIYFDDLATNFVDSFITDEKMSDTGKEFMDKYSDFVDHSFDDQITHYADLGIEA